jgi:superfamily I DNA/RNA helicase
MSDQIPLIKDDGTPFSSGEVAEVSAALDPLDAEARVDARNRNADAIAEHEAARMLIVSGPGTGKSTLFKSRLKHLLPRYPEHRVAVATFVRKLVQDLTDDISNDESISADDKARIEVSTLHRLARSMVARSHGTRDLSLHEHCLVITPFWEEVVWEDAVSLEGASTDKFPWAGLLPHLYDAEEPGDVAWARLRASHLVVSQFYNALTFADLILVATRAAGENPEPIENTLFIIDEFQDFNLAEEALIRTIAAESESLLLVGDDDQVLYEQLRRGHASIIRSYYRDASYVDAMLPFCSRCSFHITKNADAFLTSNRPPESIEKIFLPLAAETDGEKVKAVASTSPTTGVDFIAAFFESHARAIEQRKEDLQAGREKDAYLLILTPARKMKFLQPGGALERLEALVAEHAPDRRRRGQDYWTVRDYHYAAVRPTQNFNVRKVLAHESVNQEVVKELLTRALEADSNFVDLDDDVVRAALEKAEGLREILGRDSSPTEKARAVAEIVTVSDVEELAADLEANPIAGEPDPEADTSAPEQNESVAAVDVTSIVGAKGLSADHVIIVGCDNVNLAPISRSAFFVALTRARKSLTLLTCLGGGGASSLHEFVQALPSDHTEALYVKSGEIVEYPDIGALQGQLEKIEYAKKMASTKR